MPYATIDGAELYYEVHGKGFPLVFAHGAGGNHLSWWQQVPAFQKEFTCITFDHRGWGLSTDPDDLGPAAFAADLGRLLDYLELDQAFLVGQSMGGFTCLNFLMAQPERVKGLVMTNTFAGMRREVWLASGEAERKDAHETWERRRTTGVKRALARDFSSNRVAETFLYKQIRLINENGPNRLQADGQVMRLRALERAPDTSATKEALAAIGTPVLFVGGEHDEVMPVPLMRVAAALIPGARIEVVPNTAHSVHFEAPEEFNRIVGDFIRAV